MLKMTWLIIGLVVLMAGAEFWGWWKGISHLEAMVTEWLVQTTHYSFDNPWSINLHYLDWGGGMTVMLAGITDVLVLGVLILEKSKKN